jgi:hypothetical protein
MINAVDTLPTNDYEARWNSESVEQQNNIYARTARTSRESPLAKTLVANQIDESLYRTCTGCQTNS